MKDDLTIWHIHGLELPLDIEEADTVEKYEAALAQLEQNMPADKSGGTAAYIRAYCKAFRTLYDTLFGDGTAEQIFSDFGQCTAVYRSVRRISDLCGKTGGTGTGSTKTAAKKYLPKGGRR